MILLVDLRRVLKPRIPRSIVKRRLRFFDLQIDPLIVRRHLKFVVVCNPLRPRIQKNLHDIAIPQFPSFFRNILAFINIQRFVAPLNAK